MWNTTNLGAALVAQSERTRKTDPTLPFGSLNLGGNLPPLVPDTFEALYRNAIDQVLSQQSMTELVGSHRFMGNGDDRHAGARFVSQRLGKIPDHERVIVTSGTQSALDLLLSGLVGSRGVLAVEELTYPAIKPMAARLGIRLCGVRIDKDGIVPEAFAAVCESEKPTAYYTLPTLHNPTTSTTPIARRRQIVELARRHRVVFIEDDIYSMLPKDAPPPFSAIAPDIAWYVMGTAKCMVPGLKVAYVVAPTKEDVRRVFWPAVKSTYWMPAALNAAIASALINDGASSKVIDAVRAEVAARHALARDILSGIPYRTHQGALNIWLPLERRDARLRVAAFAASQDVIVGTGDPFVVGGAEAPEAIRVGLGTVLTREQLHRGLCVVRAGYRAEAERPL